MISTEKIDYSFDVMQPCKFVADKERETMEVLRRELQGTCFQGSYIIDIKEIGAISLVRTINTDNKAPSSVNVSFTAVVIRYPRGSIVPSAIVHIGDKCAYAKSTSALISLTYPVPGTDKLLSEGLKVPILISGDCSYPTGSKHVTAEGSLLACKRDFDVLKVTGTLTESEHKRLAPLIKQLHDMEAPPSDKKAQMIAMMLHTRKDGVMKSKVSSLETLANSVGESFDGYWYRALDIRMDSFFVCRSDTPIEGQEPLALSAFQMLSSFLHDVMTRRMTMNIMSKEYTDDELEMLRPVMEAHKL